LINFVLFPLVDLGAKKTKGQEIGQGWIAIRVLTTVPITGMLEKSPKKTGISAGPFRSGTVNIGHSHSLHPFETGELTGSSVLITILN
jgi:hypothetical protein